MTDPAAEPVEVVDRHGTVLRVVPRSVMRRDRLRHRSVFIAVISLSGQLLVHQRSPEKDIFASYWDIACGGVVGAGEEWGDAAERELAEEIGVVDVPLVGLDGDGGVGGDLGGDVYDDEFSHQVARCFVAHTDGPFTFADGEVVRAHFADKAAVEQLISSAAVCADSVALVLPRIRHLLT